MVRIRPIQGSETLSFDRIITKKVFPFINHNSVSIQIDKIIKQTKDNDDTSNNTIKSKYQDPMSWKWYRKHFFN